VDILTECRTMPVSPSAHTALVTGASGGIGRAIAEQFARAGTNLVLSARSEATLHEIAADWQARYGVTVTVLLADLSEPGAAAALAGRVVAAGIGIDYLVNNAGFGTFGLFAQTDLDATLGLLRVNVEALTELTHQHPGAPRPNLECGIDGIVPARAVHGGVLRQQGLRCRSPRRWRPNSPAPA
jgi:NAD(P)-dependent dehydrogenase (short-subunit alcohol dehydrogenase family)